MQIVIFTDYLIILSSCFEFIVILVYYYLITCFLL